MAPEALTSHTVVRTKTTLRYDGDCFPSDPERLPDVMRRRGYNLAEQLRYLDRAMDAYSSIDIGLLDHVGRLIEDRQELLRRHNDMRRNTLRLLDEQSAIGLPPDVNGSASSARVPRATSPDTPLASFFWLDSRHGVDEARALQENLIAGKLLAPSPSDGAPQRQQYTLLLTALGVGAYAQRRPQQMTWLGKINQLHSLIDMLVGGRVVGCENNNKWKVAAGLFVVGPARKPLTAKSLADASAILDDDRRAVRRCIPSALLDTMRTTSKANKPPIPCGEEI